MVLANNLRAELESIGRNATWLAAQVGVSKQSAHKWLKGELPTLPNLLAIARVLDIPPASLLTDSTCSPTDICGALAALERDQRAQVRDFLIFTLERASQARPDRKADIAGIIRRLKTDPAFTS